MGGNETPYPIWVKFCWMVGIPDIITCANFGADDADRLRGSEVAGVKVCPSPLTLTVALTTLWHYRASVRCSPCLHILRARVKSKLMGKLQSSYICGSAKPGWQLTWSQYMSTVYTRSSTLRNTHILQGLFQTVLGGCCERDIQEEYAFSLQGWDAQ